MLHLAQMGGGGGDGVEEEEEAIVAFERLVPEPTTRPDKNFFFCSRRRLNVVRANVRANVHQDFSRHPSGRGSGGWLAPQGRGKSIRRFAMRPRHTTIAPDPNSARRLDRRCVCVCVCVRYSLDGAAKIFFRPTRARMFALGSRANSSC